ncbi:MAG: Na+/H+ antiporter subunit E [Desulfocapsaceae bacterium]
MRHALALSILLSAFWLVNSGHYTPLLLTFMLASVASIVALSHYMDMVDGEAQPLTITFTLPIYLLWLAKEVVLANVVVAKCVWQGKKAISPRTIVVTASQKTDLGIVIYANSITLTPGTVSIDLEDNKILVHALNEESAAGLLSGEMDRRVCRVEG